MTFFFFFPFIFISWRPITLQYCSGFCHTLTWISHGRTWLSKNNISNSFFLFFFCGILVPWGFPGDPVVKNLPASVGDIRETMVQSLWREDPLEKEMATHSSILAWEIPKTEEPDWLAFTGLQSQTRLITVPSFLSSLTRDQTCAPCVRSTES